MGKGLPRTARGARWALVAVFMVMALLEFAVSGLCEANVGGMQPAAARVILLANRNNPESMALARFYAAKRGIPDANLFAYPMSASETISWPEFSSSIWGPLMSDLVRTKWIDAMPMDVADAAGRREYVVSGDRISYLVIFRGVPLRVENDPAIHDTPYPLEIARQGLFQTNQCSVDSELTLLARSLHPIESFVPNPLFHNARRSEPGEARVVKVCRIDGPSLWDAEAMIEGGIEVERRGLIGRAYVDTNGPFEVANAWFDTTERELRRLGFDGDVNRQPSTMPITARFDEPALYFGWYAPNLNGPFELPGARLAPGALAYHLHSFSAFTVRSSTQGWCGPLVALGAAGTLGNVYEPFLFLSHRPDYFLEGLERQWTLGEAAYYATPALGWEEIVLGDPLYRPLARSLDEQWAARASLGARLAGYVTLREMNLMDASGRYEGAMRMGLAEMAVRPSWALAYGLAVRQSQHGDVAAACLTVASVAALPIEGGQDWRVVYDCGVLAADCGNPALAMDFDLRLLDQSGMPAKVRIFILTEAKRVADLLGDKKSAERWTSEAEALKAAK